MVPYTYFVFRPSTSLVGATTTSVEAQLSRTPAVAVVVSRGLDGDASSYTFQESASASSLSSAKYFIAPTLLLLFAMLLQYYSTHLVTIMTLRGVRSQQLISTLRWWERPFRSFREMLVWVAGVRDDDNTNDQINHYSTVAGKHVALPPSETTPLQYRRDSVQPSQAGQACWQSRVLDFCIGMSAYGCLVVFTQYTQSQWASIREAVFPSTAEDKTNMWQLLDTVIPSTLFFLVSLPLSYKTLRFSSATGTTLTVYVAVLGVILVWIVPSTPSWDGFFALEGSASPWALSSSVLPAYSSVPLWRTVFTAVGIFVSLYSCQYALPLYLHALVPQLEDEEDYNNDTGNPSSATFEGAPKWYAAPETFRFSAASGVAMVFAFLVYLVVGVLGNDTMESLSTAHANWQKLFLGLEDSGRAGGGAGSSISECWLPSFASNGSGVPSSSTASTTNVTTAALVISGGQSCKAALKPMRTGWAGCGVGGDWVSCVGLLKNLLGVTALGGDVTVGVFRQDGAPDRFVVPLFLRVGTRNESKTTTTASPGNGSVIVPFLVSTACFGIRSRLDRGGMVGSSAACWFSSQASLYNTTTPSSPTFVIPGLEPATNPPPQDGAEKLLSGLLWALRALLLVHFLGAYPLFAITARKAYLSCFWALDEDEFFEGPARGMLLYTVTRASMTAMLVVGSAVIAYYQHGVVLVFSLNGALLGNLSAVALPCWMFTKYKSRLAAIDSEPSLPPAIANGADHDQHQDAPRGALGRVEGWLLGGFLPGAGALAGVLLALMGTTTWLCDIIA